MKLSKYQKKNIFCIEGNWSNNLKDKASIKTALEFLKANADIENIHKNCSTEDEFRKLLKTSLQKSYKKYGIIYLAFHGSPGKLHLSNRNKIDFAHLVEILQGEAKDKIIHFGSCGTLNLSGWDVRQFLKETGALAISGYKKDIDFIESTVLDILYFRICQQFRKTPLIHKEMKKYYSALIRDLGFNMIYEK